MNRGGAERAVAESNLSMAETLTMMMLLRRAHNDTLAVPDWRTPSQPQLAAEVRVSVSTIRRRLAHLERHGWVKRVPGRGRGHKSAYALLPGGVAPGPCDCRKGVTQVKPFSAVKGVTQVNLEKVSNGYTKPQVAPDIAPRAHQGGRVGKGALACIGGCGRVARRACRTCWDHAYLETAQP
jgi:helix-turn-helix protein